MHPDVELISHVNHGEVIYLYKKGKEGKCFIFHIWPESKSLKLHNLSLQYILAYVRRTWMSLHQFIIFLSRDFTINIAPVWEDLLDHEPYVVEKMFWICCCTIFGCQLWLKVVKKEDYCLILKLIFFIYTHPSIYKCNPFNENFVRRKFVNKKKIKFPLISV
jgi:hypothetical protein